MILNYQFFLIFKKFTMDEKVEEQIKNGEIVPIKIDFVNCFVSQIFNGVNYNLVIAHSIGTYVFKITFGPFEDIPELIHALNIMYRGITLNMENKKIIPKKNLREQLEFRNAIIKLVSVNFESCYSCQSYYSIKTPCGHFLSSECFYESLNLMTGTFQCEICKRIFAEIGCKNPIEIDEDVLRYLEGLQVLLEEEGRELSEDEDEDEDDDEEED